MSKASSRNNYGAPPPEAGSATRNEGARDDGNGAGAAIVASPGDLFGRWREELFTRVRRHPTQSLLVAVGTGYLAGGGLGTLLTARLLSLGARLALRAAIIPLFAGEIERAFFEDGAQETASSPTVRATRSNQPTQEKEMET